METKTALNCTSDTTVAIDTPTSDLENCSQVQAKKSSFAQKQAMQCLCGEGSSTALASAVSTAPYSETKARIDPANSYTKRIKLLIESGLVAGITPTSTRKRSDQQTLDFALSPQGGIGQAVKPETDY